MGDIEETDGTGGDRAPDSPEIGTKAAPQLPAVAAPPRENTDAAISKRASDIDEMVDTIASMGGRIDALEAFQAKVAKKLNSQGGPRV